MSRARFPRPNGGRTAHQEAVAIVAMGGVLPGAPDLEAFWKIVESGHDTASEPPAGRFTLDLGRAYDPEKGTADRVYSRRACFLTELEAPAELRDTLGGAWAHLDPSIQVALTAGYRAWKSAAMEQVDPTRISVVLANIALPTESGSRLSDRLLGREFEHRLGQALGGERPPLSGESLPADLNRWAFDAPAAVLARVLGLGGGYRVLDAACASSLFALDIAVRDLLARRVDAVLAGGVSRPDALYTQMGFAQLQALSPSGRCSPFDRAADGLVVGEGGGAFVLKRLADALDQGDRILSVIRGIGLSNDVDGRLLAPSEEGQVRAMRAAYARAGWGPETVDHVECHATGTRLGDAAELDSLRQLFRDRDWRPGGTVLGAVKGNVGHLLTGAGAAGLLKTLLALENETLAPIANHREAIEGSSFGDGPFRVLDQAIPWPDPEGRARRCAVSGFGFGGTNAHVLLEEWRESRALGVPGQGALELPERSPVTVSIVGLGARLGPWGDRRAVSRRLLGGGRSVSPEPRVGCEGLASTVVGYFLDHLDIPLGQLRVPPRELLESLPQQLLALMTAREALADSGLLASDGRLPPALGLATGVFYAISLDPETTGFHLRWAALAREWLHSLELSADELSRALDALHPALDANRTVGALGGIVASRIAREFGIGGPSFVLGSGESGGLTALETALGYLEGEDLEVAVVGGVDTTGDPRALLPYENVRLVDRSGVSRPFDRHAAGIVPGEGAVTLVLRTGLHENSRARVLGVGQASGHWQPESETIDLSMLAAPPSPEAYVAAVDRAHRNADTMASALRLLETHGSGNPAEDRVEASVLGEIARARTDRGGLPPCLGSVAATVGHTGAAGGLASVARATWALEHRLLPPGPPGQAKRSEVGEALSLSDPRFWLREGTMPRLAGVSSMSTLGHAAHAVLAEAPRAPEPQVFRSPLGPFEESLFVVEGETRDDLVRELDRLRDVASALAHANGDPDVLASLARRWWLDHPSGLSRPEGDAAPALAVSLVVRSVPELLELVGRARGGVVTAVDRRELERDSAGRVFFAPEPLGPRGDVAFVYPGSGSHYPEMGRALGVLFPEILEAAEARWSRLRPAIRPETIWDGHVAGEPEEPRDLLMAQVAFGTLTTDLIKSFQVAPQAAIGYSLGETTSLVSLGAFSEPGELLERVLESDLFTEWLAGACLAARRLWELPEDEEVEWTVATFEEDAERVDQAIAELGLARASVLVINAPGECVVGGQGRALDRLIAHLGANCQTVDGVVTVHCDIARVVEAKYRALHDIPSQSVDGVRFYSSAAAATYDPGVPGAPAQSITAQATGRVDFSATVAAAYDDGVRLFIELGPGASCSRMVSRVLEGRPHRARSMAVGPMSISSPGSLLRVLAMLATERVPLSLAALFGGSARELPTPSVRRLEVPVGRADFAGLSDLAAEVRARRQPPQSGSLPVADRTQKPREPERSRPLPVGGRVGEVASPGSPAPGARSSVRSKPREEPRPRPPRPEAVPLTVQAARSAIDEGADADYQKLTRALARRMGQSSVQHEEGQPPEPGAAPPAEPPRSLDREACLEFARGRIGAVLGARYREADTFPTRVRLPDEPLMLVDRILEIDAEPLAMDHGRVVTEHDVTADRWYLDAGRIPTAIVVEAGQADLFLAGFLGVDLETRGEAVYRLLDATVTFHRELPAAGETIRYDIEIDRFFKQGDTWLFRFHYDAVTPSGDPVLTMRDGCAGFFTEAELAAGKGVVERPPMPAESVPATGGAGNLQLAPMAAEETESYDRVALLALRSGKLAQAFGTAFLEPERVVGEVNTLPGGMLELVDRITALEPNGGSAGLGFVRGEADIDPEDWFLTCHFVDDRVMPGTLMYECCLHTLRVLLLRFGWLGGDDSAWQPVPGVAGRLRCRGQVLESTETVAYEIDVQEVGYGRPSRRFHPQGGGAPGDEGAPYAIVRALMFADGRPIVEMDGMSLRLTGTDRQALEVLWGLPASGRESASTGGPDVLPAIYDRERILAFSTGRPSEAFGAPYLVFDEQRKIARLPRPPFQFLDRITALSGQPFEMKAGASCEAQWDVEPEQWFYGANRQDALPFAVLLEAALQPCGWLAAYCGSALESETDLKFRNLGGEATLLTPLSRVPDVLTTRAELTSVSKSADMIIQHYALEVTSREFGPCYRGTTYFGFFGQAALANQVGMRDAPWIENPGGQAMGPLPDVAPLPAAQMRMVSDIDRWDPTGGAHGRGLIDGSIGVDPSFWFFEAHFFEDPVWPGSLGLEAALQLLKAIAFDRWGAETSDGMRFATFPVGHEHSWSYRGQVIPSDSRVEVQASIREIDDLARIIRADAFLRVDGRVIYQMTDFAIQAS